MGGSLGRWLRACVAGLLVLAFASPAYAAGRTLNVCKKGCRYHTIQAAVDAASDGTRIIVHKGTYHEIVEVHDIHHLTLRGVGGVVLDGTGLMLEPEPGEDDHHVRTAGIFAAHADGILVEGFHFQNYHDDGIFVLETEDFLVRRSTASFNREYGFNSFDARGVFEKVVAWGHGDSGIYVGATEGEDETLPHAPGADMPVLAIVRDSMAFHNTLGFSGSSSNHVIVETSVFTDNAAGIVPNTSPGHGAPQHATLMRWNLVYDNDFDVYDPSSDVVPVVDGVPVGTGILVAGGDYNIATENRVYGELFGILTAGFAGEVPDHNRYEGNVLGLPGQANMFDFAWTGEGVGNCYGVNVDGDGDGAFPLGLIPLPAC